MTRADVFGRSLWLWILGVSLGWFEAAVVIYLRTAFYPDGFRFPLVALPGSLLQVEIAREAASLLLLMAGARLAGRNFHERFAAFMILFGIWDLVYYAGLWIVLGWPESLATWDILFLIPVAWVGPVWAPCVVSLALIGAGSWIFCTPQRERRMRALDWGIESVAGALIIGSMILCGMSQDENWQPQHFPAWLFWLGLALGLGWFVHIERGARATQHVGVPA